MFTGIVQGLGEIVRCTPQRNAKRFWVDLKEVLFPLQEGASIAINGACLTVTEFQESVVAFDVIAESLQRSNLDQLQVGDQVNIERACRVGDEIGGHHVAGHVDVTGIIASKIEVEDHTELTISFPELWGQYLLPKGWIAIDGTSLTLVDVTADRFSVHLIPETLRRTTLGFKQEGDLVNLEFDYQAKVIVQTVEAVLARTQHQDRS